MSSHILTSWLYLTQRKEFSNIKVIKYSFASSLNFPSFERFEKNLEKNILIWNLKSDNKRWRIFIVKAFPSKKLSILFLRVKLWATSSLSWNKTASFDNKNEETNEEWKLLRHFSNNTDSYFASFVVVVVKRANNKFHSKIIWINKLVVAVSLQKEELFVEMVSYNLSNWIYQQQPWRKASPRDKKTCSIERV